MSVSYRDVRRVTVAGQQGESWGNIEFNMSTLNMWLKGN